MGVQEVLFSRGIRFHISSFTEERLKGILDRPENSGGIVYLSSAEAICLAEKSKKPLVNISGLFPRVPFPSVHLDDLEIGRVAGVYLREFAVAESACVGISRFAYSCRRIKGFLEQIEDAGVLYLDNAAAMDPEWDGKWISPRGLIGWLKKRKRPLALYLADTAEGWMEVIEDAGLRVPEDVLLLQTGGGELSLQGDGVSDRVSTVSLDVRGVGRVAAETLLALLAGKTVPEEQTLASHGVFTRLSTEFLPNQDPMVADAVRFIRAELRNVTRVNEVVGQVPLCRSLLERRFKQHMHMGIGEFIRKERFLQTRKLLIETDWPVERIADAVGFNEVTRLYEAFKQETGMTPRQFRMQL
jgi:LacI family transcriptional regulator